MSEERRAEPSIDAAAKAGGVAATAAEVEEQLDDNELEEVPVANVPPVARKASASQPDDGSSGTQGKRDTGKRGRRGMTLRIPDDEVSRPTPSVLPSSVASPPAASSSVAPPPPAATSAASPPAPAASMPDPPAVALQPMRIISIESPATSLDEAPTIVDEGDSKRARSGTQAIADKAAPDKAASATPSSEELIPISSDSDLESANGPESGEPLEIDDAESQSLLASRPPPPRTPTMPQIGMSAPPPAPPPPQRALAPTEPEGEEVKFEDDEPTPIAPPARHSEPGEAAEISAEDMVSVESVPAPKIAHTPHDRPASGLAKALAPPTPPIAYVPPPMRPRIASVPPPVPAHVPTPIPTPRPPLVIVPPHVGVAPQSGDVSARRKARPWWEDLFNDDFIRTMAKVTDKQISAEADYIEDSLGVAKGGTMLDLACGTGAHAIELARRGYEVVGFDLSLAMLARAADDAQEGKQKLNFVQGDMREMTFEDAFDGVFCWNTSFGFFDEETNAKVVGKVHKALKKGGQFVLDVANRDFVAKQAPSLAWFEGDGCVCMDEMQIDWITSRMKVKRTLMMDDGRSKEIEYSVRLYALHELGRILHEQGFRVAEVSGRPSTPGVFFGGDSPRTLILAEKR